MNYFCHYNLQLSLVHGEYVPRLQQVPETADSTIYVSILYILCCMYCAFSYTDVPPHLKEAL